MKIFFDIVPNHVGPQNPWVKSPPTVDWFHGSAEHHLTSSSPLNSCFYGQHDKAAHDPFEFLVDPHAAAQMRKNLQDGWFVNVLPDMNTENPLVVQYLIQNAIWWAEASGLDGYRIDTFPYVPRTFWEHWHHDLRAIYPRLSTIGEVFHPDPTVTSFFVGGHKGWDGIDTQVTTVFDYPLYFTLRDVLLSNAPAGRIANILRQDSLYPHPEFLVPFFANHDVPRFAGAPDATPDNLKLAFALPQLYYGDEIGMIGGGDPDNRRDFPGGWTEDPQNAFTREGRTPAQQRVFEHVRTLLHLRQEHDALRTGRLWHLYADEFSYVFLRKTDDETLLMAFNNSSKSKALTVSLAHTPVSSATSISLLFGEAQSDLAGSQLKLNLPPQSLSIISMQ
jgi:glycosidase